MNYSEISKKPAVIEVALVSDAPCEECQINYPETKPEAPKDVFGVVTGCAKLNIREEPNRDAEIVTVVAKDTKLKVDMETFDGEWIAVCTASGIQGFCMVDYIDVKD